MTSYTYSLSSDFGGNLKPRQLHNNILASAITETLQGIVGTGDVVNIIFDTALSSGDQTILDGLVSSYVMLPDYDVYNHLPVVPNGVAFNQPAYRLFARCIYPGSVIANTILFIKIDSYMDVGITSYDIRVRDATNNNVMATANFTNTVFTINDLGTISNVPTGEIAIEMDVRRNGGNNTLNVYINNAILYLGIIN
jgi:hypothetical protein